MRTNLAHPVAIRLVLTELISVLAQHQTQVVIAIEEIGQTGQKCEEAEEHSENAHDFLNPRIAHESHELAPAALSCRFAFLFAFGLLGCFDVVLLLTGISGHDGIQLIEKPMRFLRTCVALKTTCPERSSPSA